MKWFGTGRKRGNKKWECCWMLPKHLGHSAGNRLSGCRCCSVLHTQRGWLFNEKTSRAVILQLIRGALTSSNFILETRTMFSPDLETGCKERNFCWKEDGVRTHGSKHPAPSQVGIMPQSEPEWIVNQCHRCNRRLSGANESGEWTHIWAPSHAVSLDCRSAGNN